MLYRALGGRGEGHGEDVEGDKDALVLQEDNLGAKEVVTKEKDGKCCSSQEKNKTHPEDLLSLNAPEKKKIEVSNKRQEAKISTARPVILSICIIRLLFGSPQHKSTKSRGIFWVLYWNSGLMLQSFMFEFMFET